MARIGTRLPQPSIEVPPMRVSDDSRAEGQVPGWTVKVRAVESMRTPDEPRTE